MGMRYGVVVQSSDLVISTWLVAPTSTRRPHASYRPEITLDGARTRVLVEQTTVMDPEIRLGEFVGRLDPHEMRAIDDALRVVLGLD